MQAKPKKIVQISWIILVVSLLLGACGGGTTGSTLFNLPSVPLKVQPDGAVKIFGIGAVEIFGVNINPIAIPPEIVAQLQSANIQKAEVRIGYNGIHIYANGQDLPYIAWDQESMHNLQEIVPKLPTHWTGGFGPQIADALPLLRQVGLGVALSIPPQEGQSPIESPRWQGETAIASTEPGETTLGPFTIGSLAFDTEGNASIEGMPASELEGLGVALPQLDAQVLGILSALEAEMATVSIKHDGIHLSLNDRVLPSIAWDASYLESATTLAGPFLAASGLDGTVSQVLPILSGADIDLVVSFTGEPAAETSLSPIPVSISADGTLSAFGMSMGDTPMLDPAMVQSLQDANVQQLAVNLGADNLVLAANGEALPMISWDNASLGSLTNILEPALGMQSGMINGGLAMVRGLTANSPLGVQIALPLADGAEAISIPNEIDTTMDALDAGDVSAPMIRLNLAYDKAGKLQSLGGLAAADLVEAGLTLPDLPADMVSALGGESIDELQLVTNPGQLDVMLEGVTALMINYDNDSLAQVLKVAAPFLKDTPLEDPNIASLIETSILPLVATADLNVQVDIQ